MHLIPPSFFYLSLQYLRITFTKDSFLDIYERTEILNKVSRPVPDKFKWPRGMYQVQWLLHCFYFQENPQNQWTIRITNSKCIPCFNSLKRTQTAALQSCICKKIWYEKHSQTPKKCAQSNLETYIKRNIFCINKLFSNISLTLLRYFSARF